MASIQNKDILNSLVSLFDLLDSKIKSVNESMVKLEKSIKDVNNAGSGSDAKTLVENTKKLNEETAKLTELEKAQLKIKQQIETANAKLIASQSEEAKQLAEINQRIAAQNKLTKENTDFVKKQTDAYKELTKKTNEAQSNFKKLAAEFGVASNQAKSAKVEFDKLDNQLRSINNAAKDGRRDVGRYRMVLEGTGNAIKTFIAGLGIQQLFNFGKAIVETRAEFQKYAIVLENSLGSSRKAAEAMQMIEEFAAKTPFSVAELTASYIKLVNQGFKPTQAEMVKLGDLASSTGKSFDQLTEAIIDAGAFEFERLKEFGIRAKKEGDKIKFTFKDQETTVNASNDAIRKYLLSLGELPGVLGANEKIAQGLTGQISNLGDAWDGLLNTFGKFIEVPVSKTLGFISEKLQQLRGELENTNNESTTFADRMLSWTKIVGKLNPVFSFLVEKLTIVSWLEGKVKEQRDKKNKSEKENLITQEQYNKAVQKGINEAQIEYFELHKNDKLKKETTDTNKKLTASQIAEIKAKKELNEQYEIELQRRLELKMSEEDLPDVKQLTATSVSSENPIVKANEDMQSMLQKQRDAAEDDKIKKHEAEKEREQERIEIITAAAAEAGNIIGNLFAKGQLTFKEFTKVIVLSALDALERSINLLKVQAFAQQVAGKGFLGIATGGVLVGLITAAFAAVKAKVQSFAEGTEYVHGEGTETSDSIPARLSKGERVVPSKINKLLLGIPNNRLPELVANGINTQRMESILEEVKYYNKMSSLYLANGSNTYVKNGFLVIKDWRTGETTSIPIKE